MKLLKNWYRPGPSVLNWQSSLRNLTLEAREGVNSEGEQWVWLFDDGMPVWNCNATFFRAHFYTVKDSGKSLKAG